MRITSLGYKTDLIFPAFDGDIIDRGNYRVIRTLSNPDFYWGNFLLFPKPPGEGDFEKWRGLFSKEIAPHAETQHEAFGWDSAAGDEGIVRPFIATGFRLNRNVVMTNREPRVPARNSADVDIRALRSESDWQQALDNQVICREPEFDEADHRVFRQRQMSRYRSMSQAGRGDWYGAFFGPRLVADLGIFHADGLGRFQSVQTHPDFRSRGIAATLVAKSARQALGEYDLHMLVIVAEEGLAPQRLYESIGFEPTERQVGLAKWPQRNRLMAEGV
jgi:ribosomal protein S18 acetylase RimI-like enzyme